jgi:SsrA-binding protein
MSFIVNKKASLTHTLGEHFDAGIELTGQEVKSVKQKQGSLEGARVIVRGGEVYLIGSFIPPFQANNAGKSYDGHRIRKLLLTKKEIEKLYYESENKHLTIIPLSLYGKGVFIKCSFVLAKIKTKGDKRESLKEKDSKRELRNAEREMK